MQAPLADDEERRGGPALAKNSGSRRAGNAHAGRPLSSHENVRRTQARRLAILAPALLVHISLHRLLPLLDLAGYPRRDFGPDALAALAATFLTVPQVVAYAMIAGLPPAMGLYAAAMPAVLGGMFRSSRFVVTGPTNALSLLVGTAIAAAQGIDPVQAAITLALLVGVVQLAAGVLRLGVLADYISRPVVVGYISGAGILIVLGQLPNVTATDPGDAHGLGLLWAWARHLEGTRPAAVAMAVATIIVIYAIRKRDRRIPGAVVVMGIGIVLGYALDLRAWGVPLVADLTPVPRGLPPVTIPDLSTARALASGAFACTVLSLVESTSVARNVADQTGERIQRSVEFAGQGIANIAAAFTGGFPTSGSLARTAQSREAGARSRLASILSGLMILAILLVFGPVVDHTPIPVLAGLLLVLGIDLVDRRAIAMILRGHGVDRLGFLGTIGGTLLLPLDEAIYLGVAISIVMFLRRARILSVQEMIVDAEGRLTEVTPRLAANLRCPAIRFLQVAGALFFASAGELRGAFDRALLDPDLRVLVVRVKRTIALDLTTAEVIAATARRLIERDGALLLVGFRDRDRLLLARTGLADRIGRENLFPSEPGWFAAMDHALSRACSLVGDHGCGTRCPIARWRAR